MGQPQPAKGGVDIEALARPFAVDHRITLPNYFRIAESLLGQIYREEKNFLELYVILLRYSSLLCETIPKHRDYRAFKSSEKEFFKKKLMDAIDELESLSLNPVVQKQITEINRGGTVEPHSPNGTYAATHRTEQHTPSSYTPQPLVGSAIGLLQKFGRRQAASLPSVQPDKQISERYVNLRYQEEETLSRHSILGPDGFSGQWTGPAAEIKVQYPSNIELAQSDISSLVLAILN